MAQTIQKDMDTLHKNTERLLMSVSSENIGLALNNKFKSIFQILNQQQTLISHLLNGNKTENSANKRPANKSSSIFPELKGNKTSSKVKTSRTASSAVASDNLTCYDCGLTFHCERKREFLKHVEISNCSPYKCSICNALFKRVSSQISSFPYTFINNLIFFKNDSCTRHFKSVHLKQKNQVYPCTFNGCKLSFNTVFLLARHTKTHHIKAEAHSARKLRCTFGDCKLSFDTVSR